MNAEEKLQHNEKTKLVATWLNNVSSGLFLIGVATIPLALATRDSFPLEIVYLSSVTHVILAIGLRFAADKYIAGLVA
ncbi:hypothetical protein [Roseomonas xinghualingensis]|uniref:hypothetical protein n=1 Tax=Roseomonas xinghualingensis TaxID=2986475 RepID=UPI0021F22261|nr:hypothetical protein [Roseomonas sp. SXEYE001]MCV4206899.1 hypothetical protein [Roseomonas sp. SXEYE001]